MRVGIYSELLEGNALGGREYIVAVVCDELAARGHTVEFSHHQPNLTPEVFAAQFGIAPERVRLRTINTRPPASLRSLRASKIAQAHWDRELSGPYDLFLNIVHANPVECHAPRGVLMVLFPFFEPFKLWPDDRMHEGESPFRLLMKRLYLRVGWHRCMNSYQLKSSISEYSQHWAKHRWQIDSTVIYPPTDAAFPRAEKTNSILSVGRFSGFRLGGLSKRQLEMLETFLALRSNGADGWSYYTLGSIGSWQQDREYLSEVANRAKAADGGDVHVLANAARETLALRSAEAKIFWHAAGFNDNQEKHPELMEHFGIATVDAMAAGCVPVVISRGAQPEIVRHGVDGFLWQTLDELKHYTRTLMDDDKLRAQMAAAAQERAKTFSRAAFVERFLRFIGEPSAPLSAE